jgi:hypothetical protein
MGRFSPNLFRFFRRLVTSGLDQKAPPKIHFSSAWSDHNPGLLLAGSILVRELRLGYNPLLGHVVLFLSRLNFIFVGASSREGQANYHSFRSTKLRDWIH